MKALIAIGLFALGCGGDAGDLVSAAPDLYDEIAGPTCALEGDYSVKYLPSPGCGYVNEFPARIALREVKCDTPDQHCEPGVPSARCDFTRKLSDDCETRVIWTRLEP